MSGSPPDKLYAYDLSAYTTISTRVAEINTLVSAFYADFGVYPTFIVLDSIVNAVYLGAY